MAEELAAARRESSQQAEILRSLELKLHEGQRELETLGAEVQGARAEKASLAEELERSRCDLERSRCDLERSRCEAQAAEEARRLQAEATLAIEASVNEERRSAAEARAAAAQAEARATAALAAQARAAREAEAQASSATAAVAEVERGRQQGERWVRAARASELKADEAQAHAAAAAAEAAALADRAAQAERERSEGGRAHFGAVEAAEARAEQAERLYMEAERDRAAADERQRMTETLLRGEVRWIEERLAHAEASCEWERAAAEAAIRATAAAEMELEGLKREWDAAGEVTESLRVELAEALAAAGELQWRLDEADQQMASLGHENGKRAARRRGRRGHVCNALCRVPCAVCLAPCALRRVPCAVCLLPCALRRVPCAFCRVPDA